MSEEAAGEAASFAFMHNLRGNCALDTDMGDQVEAMECSKCARRFAAPAILESGRCPSCGGDLMPLEEAREPDKPGGDH